MKTATIECSEDEFHDHQEKKYKITFEGRTFYCDTESDAIWLKQLLEKDSPEPLF